MTLKSPISNPVSAIRYPLSAFSLVEIMFAVMILGIGFIMIAGLFPVAIEQSRATVADTTGTIVADGATRMLKASPKTWLDAPLVSANWEAMGMGSQQISAADPKFAFIGFKKRPVAGTPTTYFLFSIAVAAQNTSSFPLGSVGGDLNAANHAASFGLEVHTADPSLITFTTPDSQAQAVEGAFVLISTGALQDKLLVLGAARDAANGIWELLPGPAIGAEGALVPGLTGFIVGRGLNDPTSLASGWAGPSIAVHASEMGNVTK